MAGFIAFLLLLLFITLVGFSYGASAALAIFCFCLIYVMIINLAELSFEKIKQKINIKTKKLFVYARANAMVDHRFTDDIALCYACSLDEAVTIFSKMYDKDFIFSKIQAADYIKKHTFEARFNDNGICVCTDY